MDWLSPDSAGQQFIQENLQNKMDLVLACQFFHLFGWEGQKIAMKQVVQCSKVGTVVLGFQIGSTDPKEMERHWGKLPLRL